MILVFGIISTQIQTNLDAPVHLGGQTIAAQDSVLGISGSSTVQAISAARGGAKVSLIGTVGNDVFGKHCLDTLRREGINTSGIGKNKTNTGLEISLKSSNNKTTKIVSRGANQHSHAGQIPEMHINERSLLLLSDDTDESTLLNLLNRTREKSGRSILCLNHAQKISNDTLTRADIIIADEKIIVQNADNYTVITKNSGISGASAYFDQEEKCNYDLKDVANTKDTNGCFDVFCGFFAACIQAGLPIKRAISFASKAALTASQKNGIYDSIPYLGHIEDIDKNIKTQNC